MESENKRPINGVNFTTEYSYITVIYTGNELLLDFPYDEFVINTIKQNIKGARYDKDLRKWKLPKDRSRQLKGLFPPKMISFKTQEQIKEDAKYLSFQEESIEEVLNRIPKKIDTSFMKLPAKNFQKVMIGWVATPKGKRGNVYGGILGDTMGLGKTIQALASAAYLKHIGKIKRCLIVTEAGLKTQWAEETEKFTHEKFVVIESGSKANPQEHRKNLLKSVVQDDIFYTIASYELLAQREIIGTEEVLEKGKVKKKQIKGNYTDLTTVLENEYDMIILDEAQKIRNLDTLVCQAIYEIQSPKYRLIMTGTPIEKEIENIFPLIDYLSPNIFADESLTVKERLKLFEDKFLIKSLEPHALPQRVPVATGTKNLDILNRILQPYMLRRTIDDISDEMPKAEVQVETADWEENQLSFYNEVVEMLQTKNEEWGEAYRTENAILIRLEAAKRSGKPDPKLEDAYLNFQTKRILLENEVQALRLYALEICDTPELILWSDSPIAHRLLLNNAFFSKIFKKAQKIRKDPTLDEKQIEEKLHELFEKEVPMIPKVKRYIDSIEELCLKNEEKVITFTKFETMSRILQRKINLLFNPDLHSKKKKKRPALAQVVMYTGATRKGCQWKSKLKRQGNNVENLNCSECPFLEKCNTRNKSKWHLQNDPFTKLLIATDAANAGVNLQSARYNFNYDLPDSPSKYNQRNGRIQRIGSPHKVVFFINLVTAEGIDAKKYDKIVKKQSDINTAIDLNEEQKLFLTKMAENMEDDIEDDFNDDVNLNDEQDIIKGLKIIKK